MALAKGFTRDGWEYSISFSEKDGKFRVRLDNLYKEVWLLEELVAEPHGTVYVRGKPKTLYKAYVKGKPTIEGTLEEIASQIAYELETRGAADVIRGTKKETPKPISVTPWGAARLVLGKAAPSAGAVAEILRERREMLGAPPAPTPPTLPTLPKVPISEAKKYAGLGLGSEGLRRLRVLFESTVTSTMGAAPTREMKVMAEDFIYRLDSKYKFVPRDEAIEKATLELLRWIRDEFYFNPEF